MPGESEGAHMYCRLVRLPSVEGIVPVSWLLYRYLHPSDRAMRRKVATNIKDGRRDIAIGLNITRRDEYTARSKSGTRLNREHQSIWW